MSDPTLSPCGQRACRSCRRPVSAASRWNGLEHIILPVERREHGLVELDACPHCGEGVPVLEPPTADDLARWADEQVDPAGRTVTGRARALAAQLDQLFDQDAELAQRLNDAQHRLTRANDQLWNGLHPDALATVYNETVAATGSTAAANRSDVLAAPDPLAAVQQAHWTIHRGFTDYQDAAEQRRTLAATIGEIIREFIAELTDAGWTKEEATNADVREVARPIQRQTALQPSPSPPRPTLRSSGGQMPSTPRTPPRRPNGPTMGR